jgi:predicted nucleotidyltransferase
MRHQPETPYEHEARRLFAAAEARRSERLAAARALAKALRRDGAHAVYLFGSVARLDAWVGPESDVDLAVVMPGVEGQRFHRRLLDHPAVTAFPYPLDLFVYTPAEWERLVQERSFVQREILGQAMEL